MLDDSILEQIKIYSESSPDREVCGFVVYSEGNILFKECKNTSQDPNQFKIRSADFLRIKTSCKILYVFHSHILSDSEPSEIDKQKSDSCGYKFLIYSLVSKTFSYYEPNGFVIPYVGRDFNIGSKDCFSLARDYFFNEFGIVIRDYPRTEFWKNKNPNLIVDNFKKENFSEISESDLKRNDTILIEDPRTGILCHILIYMGNNEILHHPNGRKSTIENYSERYRKLSKIFLRHDRFNTN